MLLPKKRGLNIEKNSVYFLPKSFGLREYNPQGKQPTVRITQIDNPQPITHREYNPQQLTHNFHELFSMEKFFDFFFNFFSTKIITQILKKMLFFFPLNSRFGKSWCNFEKIVSSYLP